MNNVVNVANKQYVLPIELIEHYKSHPDFDARDEQSCDKQSQFWDKFDILLNNFDPKLKANIFELFDELERITK